MTLRADARFTLNEIFIDRVYDAYGIDYSSLQNILDIGANMGIYALYAASKAPQATIHCFEPCAENFEILSSNISTNAIHAKPYKLAVSNMCGVGHLEKDTSSVEYSLGEAKPTSEEVECIDLSKVFELSKVDTFDFMKMDIEGAEREVFNSSADHLLTRIKALAIEWHHSWEELESLAERFRRLGFTANPMILQGHIRYLVAKQP